MDPRAQDLKSEAVSVLKTARAYAIDFKTKVKNNPLPHASTLESLNKLIELHRKFIVDIVLPARQIPEAKALIENFVNGFNDIFKSINAVEKTRQLHLDYTAEQIAKASSDSEKLKISAAEIIALTSIAPTESYFSSKKTKAAIAAHQKYIQNRANDIYTFSRNYNRVTPEDKYAINLIHGTMSYPAQKLASERYSHESSVQYRVDLLLKTLINFKTNVDVLLSEIKSEEDKNEHANLHVISEKHKELREYAEMHSKKLFDSLPELLAESNYPADKQKNILEQSKNAYDYVQKKCAEGLKKSVSDDKTRKLEAEVKTEIKVNAIPPSFVTPPKPLTREVPAAPVQAIPAQPAPIASPAHAPRVETKDEVVKAPQEVEVKTKTDTIPPLFVPSPMPLTPIAPAASVQDTPAPIASPASTPRLETKEEKAVIAPQSEVKSEVKLQPASSSSTPYRSHEARQFFRMTRGDVNTLPNIKGTQWTISDIKNDMEKKYRTITNGENSFFAYPDRLTTNDENVDTYLAMIEAYRKLYSDKMDSMVITPKSHEQVSKWQEACRLANVPIERIAPPAPPVTSALTPDAPAPASPAP